jgi:nucleotide-binding universal stress UspA family protein
MELQRILAATDFSECGNHAVRRAALLAADSGAQLRLLHALPRAALTWALLRYSGTEAESSLRNAAQMLLAEVADELRSRLNLDVECLVDTGAAHRVIGDAVEIFQPDLLAVGAHGKGMVQQLWLGGTASKLLTQSARPLLVVRLPAQAAHQSAVAAVDLGPRTAAVLAGTRALAPHATARAVHAFHAPYEDALRASGADDENLQRYRDEARLDAEQRLAALVPESALMSRKLIDGHPTTVLLELAQRHTELMVVARHSGTRFGDLMLGSVPRLLAFHAECDVMVV